MFESKAADIFVEVRREEYACVFPWQRVYTNVEYFL